MFSVLPIQLIDNQLFPHYNGKLAVLRMDKIHTIVSGNKWFKLKYYLQEARSGNFKTIATFGGAYSNHIVATAYAAKLAGIKSIGVIRGEKPDTLSHTLQNALDYGMHLEFVNREAYSNKSALKQNLDPNQDNYWINEGGYGDLGATGIQDLFKSAPLWQYTHLVTAVGTGTTMAGLIRGALPYQQVIGVNVLKNQPDIKNEVKALLSPEQQTKNYLFLAGYEFGGYAKKTPVLIDFMNHVNSIVNLPLDFVYTAKTLYALGEYLKTAELPADSQFLFMHTGGLQGNLSLPPGTLRY